MAGESLFTKLGKLKVANVLGVVRAKEIQKDRD